MEPRRKITATSLALEIRAAIRLGEFIDEGDPVVRQMLRRAIFEAARDVIAEKLAGGHVGRAIAPEAGVGV